jgi:VIT1/CCC1 family predicted Fe2+/Mn2+ transporter
MPGKQGPFSWVSRDGKLIILVRGLRTFALSTVSVLLAIYFDLQGFSLVQMDNPAMQSYTMAVVGSQERSAMAMATSVSRSGGTAAGPAVSAALWSATSASAPFLVGGVLKIAYDLTL